MKPRTRVAAQRSLTSRVGWSCLLGGLLLLIPIQQAIDRQVSSRVESPEALFIPSSRLLRSLSLGHEGLLADIYWTRVVQYFGRKKIAHSNEFRLLAPLLMFTTSLDPHLVIAYRFGAIFLAEKPPGGAGEPEQALQLLRRGIVANPDYWRLWEDLGFVYYWDLKDYTRASQVFATGSERPGAMVWMKSMAATLAAKGGDTQTSIALWSQIYREGGDDQIRESALAHIAALKAEDDLRKLDELLARYAASSGRKADSFRDLIAAGLLRSLPEDPWGTPYTVRPGGHAGLGPSTRVDLRFLQ